MDFLIELSKDDIFFYLNKFLRFRRSLFCPHRGIVKVVVRSDALENAPGVVA